MPATDKPILECVPNFSEGRDTAVIEQIVQAISAVGGIQLLEVDIGKAANRAVVSFAGSPEAVMEAAFQSIRQAATLIDMRQHQGVHPRFGATDVCPLIPISGVLMAEAVALAHRLGQRVGRELGIPVYFYENAARTPQRKNLAAVRAGEYEGIAQKINLPQWRPDEGPAAFNPKTGNIAIGARELLVAYNVNLNTASVEKATLIAQAVRESGYVQRTGDPLNGPVVKDATGRPVRIKGRLQHVKAIGWYIEDYGQAQVSMNLIAIDRTPLHRVYETVKTVAQNLGVQVTGSELVGLAPLRALLETGRFYLARQPTSAMPSEAQLIAAATQGLGLDDVRPFEPKRKILEYVLKSGGETFGNDSAQ